MTHVWLTTLNMHHFYFDIDWFLLQCNIMLHYTSLSIRRLFYTCVFLLCMRSRRIAQRYVSRNRAICPKRKLLYFGYISWSVQTHYVVTRQFDIDKFLLLVCRNKLCKSKISRCIQSYSCDVWHIIRIILLFLITASWFATDFAILNSAHYDCVWHDCYINTYITQQWSNFDLDIIDTNYLHVKLSCSIQFGSTASCEVLRAASQFARATLQYLCHTYTYIYLYIISSYTS